MEKNYYLRFDHLTQKVKVFRRTDDSLIQSVEVINGIVSSIDVEQIALALNISGKNQITELEYDIFYEDRYWRELEEESLQEV